MPAFPVFRFAARLTAAGASVASAVYAGLAINAWRGYGTPPTARDDERDKLLDRFIPVYDVVERHRIVVAASPAAVLAAAKEQDLMGSPLIRAIFKARAVALGASPDELERPRGLLAAMQSWGWGVLAEEPDREVVVGAVTRPWEADVVFRSLPPAQFATFNEPGNVKIVWTLRVKPISDNRTVFFTETRAVATDSVARRKFRRYWAFASPGIAAIRWLSLLPLKRDAEQRARATDRTGTSAPAQPRVQERV
jgi:hypothetical protein